MSDASTETQSVVIERELPHPPEKVWRVLTQPHFIEEWLQTNDFEPVVDHAFKLNFDWGVVDCRVLAVDPHRTLSYTWASGELDSVVTWTLTPTESGTRLHMEQTGFRPAEPGQSRYFHGARAGWPRFFDAIDDILAKLD
jgi:uncharacterized protein YndB with AHSA1/START domain